MEAVTSAAEGLLSLVGPLWPIVWIAAFVVMTLESSAPKPPPNEPAPEPSGFSRLGALANAALPFVLLLHGFGAFVLANQDQGGSGAAVLPLIVLFVAVGVVTFAPSWVGGVIGALVPVLGSVLYRIAPALALIVLAFALYATWENVGLVVDLYLRTRLH